MLTIPHYFIFARAWKEIFLNFLLKALVLEEAHALRHDQIERLRHQAHADVPGPHGLAVDVDHVLFVEGDGERVGPQVGQILGILVRVSGGVFPDQTGEGEEADG